MLQPVLSTVLVVAEAQSVWDWLHICHYSRGSLWSSTALLVKWLQWQVAMCPTGGQYLFALGGLFTIFVALAQINRDTHTHRMDTFHSPGNLLMFFFSNIISKLWSWKFILCRNKIHLLINQLKIYIFFLVIFHYILLPASYVWEFGGEKGFLGMWL